MSTLIPPTPAANKSAEQHQEPSEQDSFNHLLYKVLRLTSEQVNFCMDIPIQHQGHFQCHHQEWNCSTHPGLHQKAL